MILMVSGRTDICAYYSKWLSNRIEAGYFDVRNPFNEKLVSRIYFEDVKLINFCTKNPIPVVDLLDKIHKPILFMVTLTGYRKDIEPNVPDKKGIIEAIKKISLKIGKENTIVRYDPILLNSVYTKEYHIKAMEKLLIELSFYIDRVIISFMKDYKNVRNNMDELKSHTPKDTEYSYLSIEFDKLASKYNTKIVSCAEGNLDSYGFHSMPCISQKYAYEKTNHAYPLWHERDCSCAEMVDIGAYNSCMHMCKYCYANYDEKRVLDNMKRHNPSSSLLIGELKKDDIIKRRIK